MILIVCEMSIAIIINHESGEDSERRFLETFFKLRYYNLVVHWQSVGLTVKVFFVLFRVCYQVLILLISNQVFYGKICIKIWISKIFVKIRNSDQFSESENAAAAGKSLQSVGSSVQGIL